MWKSEYLLKLCEAHQYHEGRPNALPASVGDTVLVEEDDKLRVPWKLATVTQLITGRNRYTQGTVLCVSTNGGHRDLHVHV